MAVLTRKVTKPQREWLKSYESSTGFEPMLQEDLDRSPETFASVAKRNMEWFRNWSTECELHLGAELEKLTHDGVEAAT